MRRARKNASPQKQVNFVEVRGYLFPRLDADYEQLKQLKVPVDKAKEDFGPLLGHVLKANGFKMGVVSLADMEKLLVNKVTKVCPLPFEMRKNDMVFVTNRPDNPRMVELIGKITDWYSRYGVRIEAQHKRTRLTLTKVYQ